MIRLARAMIGLLALACGPTAQDASARTYAEAFCNALSDCGCARAFDSTTSCIEDFSAGVQAELDRGLHVVDECFDPLVESLTNDSCEPAELAVDGGGLCVSLKGAKKAGETCGTVHHLRPLIASECGEGLTCKDGLCTSMRTPPPPKMEGDRCDGSSWDSCYRVLADPLYCGYDDICHQEAQVGQPCQDFGCDDAESYCAGAEGIGMGICETRVPLGETCNPLDWRACALGENDETTFCDPATNVCVLGSSLCAGANWPYLWR